MQIRSFYRMATFGVSVPFGVFDGVEPYTFSVIPEEINGAGGSISPNGLYTAPNNEGTDTVRVQDANGDIATAKIMVGGPLKIVADIISKYMGLGSDQVFIYNSKISPPKDSKLYVNISPLPMKVFSSSNKFKEDSEEIGLNIFSPLDISIYSRSSEAILRKEEVVMALNSTYSKQQQELNCIYLGKISNSIVPINAQEGAAIPYAFNITANIQYVSKKKNLVQYFDNFSDVATITNP